MFLLILLHGLSKTFYIWDKDRKKYRIKNNKGQASLESCLTFSVSALLICVYKERDSYFSFKSFSI